MKTRELIVPRRLIKKFYPHPECYGDGDYVVDLVNGMYTDVFYREDGDFVTITNNKDLIAYIISNPRKSREYFFRNGVYSFHHILEDDIEIIETWNDIKPISVQLEITKGQYLPSHFMFCFYWIEVGKVSIVDHVMTFDVFENDLIQMIDISVAINLVIELLKNS